MRTIARAVTALATLIVFCMACGEAPLVGPDIQLSSALASGSELAAPSNAIGLDERPQLIAELRVLGLPAFDELTPLRRRQLQCFVGGCEDLPPQFPGNRFRERQPPARVRVIPAPGATSPWPSANRAARYAPLCLTPQRSPLRSGRRRNDIRRHD
jgi:hypothetical protein